jgi:hypothetical protein
MPRPRRIGSGLERIPPSQACRIHLLLPLESILRSDSGNSGIGVTPDAVLTENQEGIVILLTIENREPIIIVDIQHALRSDPVRTSSPSLPVFVHDRRAVRG